MGRNSGGIRGSGNSYGKKEIENALYDYVNGYSDDINMYLRSPSSFSLTAENKQHIKVLDSILTDRITNETLYRKTEAKSIFGNLSQSEYESLYLHVVEGWANGYSKKVSNIVGKTIQEKGFMSTSKQSYISEDIAHATNPIMLRINTNKKAKGMDLGRHSIDEEEVLLKRNTKYKVKKVYGKSGYIYVDVDII